MNREEVQAIVDEELERAHARIIERLQPLLQKEFDAAKREYPALKRVLFGNGAVVFDTGNPGYRTLPPTLQKLEDSANALYCDHRFWICPDDLQ
jgi:hypothetical protein